MAGIIGGVATVASGIMGAGAASKAASQQAAQGERALQFQEGVYNTEQGNLNPFIGTGTSALGSLAQLYGLQVPGAPAGSPGAGGNALDAYKSFTQTPFYQFPLQQGQATLERSGAARGLTLSGGQSNALQQYGQNYASQGFGQYISGLGQLANLGQTSAVQLGNSGNAAGQAVGQSAGYIGNAQAAGTVGSANQLKNALSGLGPILGTGTSNQGSSYGNGGGGLINAISGLFGGGGVPSTPGDLSGYGATADSYNNSGAPIVMGGS
jgi:hypothetical protein